MDRTTWRRIRAYVPVAALFAVGLGLLVMMPIIRQTTKLAKSLLADCWEAQAGAPDHAQSAA